MADSTLDDQKFILIDNWPGLPDPRLSEPKDGFTGSDHHNVATAAYPVGTKIQVYCPGTNGNAGFATFIYLQAESQDSTNVIAAKNICIPADTQTSNVRAYEVTNDNGDDIGLDTGLCAVAISAMTTGYYGWFWCGGVCPVDFVSGLGGNYCTDGTVAAGTAMCVADSTSATLALTYGEFTFSKISSTAINGPAVGTSFSADA